MAVRWSGQRRAGLAGSWREASGEQWTIGDAGHRATLVQVGGGLRSYDFEGTPLVAGYADDQVAPAAAGQTLAPWPNRVGNGRYSFRGAEYQLPLDEPERHNAIHGLVRWLPWECTQRGDSNVTLSCRLAPQPGYPWPLELSTAWEVSAVGLRATHSVTNLGSEPCPFGLGAHPYVAVAGRTLDQLTLQLPVTWRLLSDERLLPVSREQTAGTAYDFRQPTPIRDLVLDATFAGVRHGADGIARSRLAEYDGSAGVEVWQDSKFGWLQVYSGPGVTGRAGEVLAIEPMTCPPDAFNSREDLILLQPGQTWTGSWGIRPLR